MTRWLEREQSYEEPARDERLAALLRDVVGDAALTRAEWERLADRIAAALPMSQVFPW